MIGTTPILAHERASLEHARAAMLLSRAAYRMGVTRERVDSSEAVSAAATAVHMSKYARLSAESSPAFDPVMDNTPSLNGLLHRLEGRRQQTYQEMLVRVEEHAAVAFEHMSIANAARGGD